MIRVSTPDIPASIATLIPNLGRANDYEVISTARAIGKSLRAVGLDFHDLAQSLSPKPPAPLRPANFGDLARACRDLDRGRLTPNERRFVMDACRRGFSWQPTTRQVEWLNAILLKLRGRAAA